MAENGAGDVVEDDDDKYNYYECEYHIFPFFLKKISN